MIKFLYIHNIIKSNLITLIKKSNVNYRLLDKKVYVKITNSVVLRNVKADF